MICRHAMSGDYGLNGQSRPNVWYILSSWGIDRLIKYEFQTLLNQSLTLSHKHIPFYNLNPKKKL